jgi:Uma2 family endonuclease
VDSMTDRVSAVPPLVDGERLSLAEFRRRYEAMPRLKKAELIGGVVHVASPVRTRHARNNMLLVTCLGNYAVGTPGVEGLDNATIRLGDDDEPQPDVALRRLRGGTSVEEDGWIKGPPELAAEVSVSTLARDLKAKRAVYEGHGCAEYLVLAPVQGQLHAFVRQGAMYQARP